MALLIRPLWQWPRLHRHCASLAPFHRHHRHLSSSFSLLFPSEAHSIRQFLGAAVVPLAKRSFHQPARGLRFPNAPAPNELREGEASDSDADTPMSRNQKKREARRAVRWGMDIASFTAPQIKRISRLASLGPEVFEAIMVVKRLGSDVKEGKRRQYNYIGKLLREAEPELMDTLIKATKDGDESTLQALSVSEGSADENEDDVSEVESEEEEVEYDEYASIAARWCDGLISRDVDITKEVYSLRSIDFDRQELRKLVRSVHSIQEQEPITESHGTEEDGPELTRAKKSLNRFLLTLAKMPGSDI